MWVNQIQNTFTEHKLKPIPLILQCWNHMFCLIINVKNAKDIWAIAMVLYTQTHTRAHTQGKAHTC